MGRYYLCVLWAELERNVITLISKGEAVVGNEKLMSELPYG